MANHHSAGKVPLVRCFDAFGHEFLLDLSPELQQSLRLGLVLLPFHVVPLLGSDNVPSQLLHERHDGQGQVLTRLCTESYLLTCWWEMLRQTGDEASSKRKRIIEPKVVLQKHEVV